MKKKDIMDHLQTVNPKMIIKIIFTFILEIDLIRVIIIV
jgi:hypothetical protein